MTKALPVWRGWMLVDEDGIVVDNALGEPYVWKDRKDALDCKDEGQRVVRCELRVLK